MIIKKTPRRYEPGRAAGTLFLISACNPTSRCAQASLCCCARRGARGTARTRRRSSSTAPAIDGAVLARRCGGPASLLSRWAGTKNPVTCSLVVVGAARARAQASSNGSCSPCASARSPIRSKLLHVTEIALPTSPGLLPRAPAVAHARLARREAWLLTDRSPQN